MASSQHLHDSPPARRTQQAQSSRQPQSLAQSQPLLHSEPVQVAPYLTHVVAHHGQLTLIPPQNAGRIRKTRSKKKKQPSSRDRRLEDEEPRFTTAVPASSSRKLHPAPAHIRTRKHAISAPPPTTPTASRRFDPIPDDQSIPDYPPPSFEDAIASPHVPPHLASIPSLPNTPVQPDASADTPVTLQQHPYTSHVASLSSATILSSSTLGNGSPAVSHISDTRPHEHHLSLETRSSVAGSASVSTTTLLSPVTTTSESTAISDMSLLRPPRPRTTQPSPLAQSASRQAPSSPVRLTSPSTTTLVTPANVMRDSPALSQATLIYPQDDPRGLPQESEGDDLEESGNPIIAALSPLSPPDSPHLQHRDSMSTVSDLVEELSFEPYQRWSADRRLGLSLEQRVQREFERRNTKEAKEAFGIVSHLQNGQEGSSMPSTPPSSPNPRARRCSHCGSLRPRECGDTQTIDEHSDEDDQEDDEDEDDFSPVRRSSPLPRGAGRSPYLHPASTSKAHSRNQSRVRFHSHSPEPGSPASPMSPSMSFFKMPSAWASTVTLSLANALVPHKTSSTSSASPSAQTSSAGHAAGSGSSSGSALKRKESFGVKRLFGSLKGKEREREQREREYAHLPPPSSSVSSSESSTESVDGWEVVGSESTSPSSHSSSGTTPTSPARSTSEASSPTSESMRTAAFIHRPVRHRPPPLPFVDSPTTPTSPSAVPPSALPAVGPGTMSAAVVAARPYLPEKSPLRLIASANHIQQTHAHGQVPPQAQALGGLGQSSPVSASSPLIGTPRILRPSPSVVWKPPVGGPGGQISPVQRSPLSQQAYHPPAQQQSPSHQLQPQPQMGALHRVPSPLQLQSQPLLQSPPSPPSPPAGPRAAPIGTKSPYPSPLKAAETASDPPQNTSISTARREPAPTSSSPSGGSLPSPQLTAHFQRRREVTPPPPAHRRVVLACDTAASAYPNLRTSSPEEQGEAEVGTGVGALGEPGSVSESLSIEQLMAHSASMQPKPQTPTRTPTTPSRGSMPPTVPPTPATAGSTPTTPTFGPITAATPGPSPRLNQSQSQHYRGRPLPQLPPEADAEAMPVKPIPDGTPVNRASGNSSDVEPPPPPPPDRSTTQPLPRETIAVPTAMESVAPSSGVPLPLRMERSDSGDSVVEDAQAAEEGPRPEFLQITDLDVLASRLVDGPHDGGNYEVRPPSSSPGSR
ncbi:hypothetical protein BD414DRAFT_224734 [Trametes punicea]|nr:hypothetical protein BD414DRAFT_224734 [Trametes punicea]